MSGKGYENGKYFEINRRGKLKESKALPMHKIDAELYKGFSTKESRMLTLTVDHKGKTEKGINLSPGDKLEYLGHLPGGNVGIRFLDNKKEDIAHPHCFKELK